MTCTEVNNFHYKAVTSVGKMILSSICVGLGLGITNANGQRLLFIDARQHASVLWASLFNEQLN